MNVPTTPRGWARGIGLALLAIILSGIITAYIGGGLFAFAVIYLFLAIGYEIAPKYRIRIEQTTDSDE